jgi:hypothetical protein
MTTLIAGEAMLRSMLDLALGLTEPSVMMIWGVGLLAYAESFRRRRGREAQESASQE